MIIETIKQPTPRKINIESENDGLEDDFPLQMDKWVMFWFHVNLVGCTPHFFFTTCLNSPLEPPSTESTPPQGVYETICVGGRPKQTSRHWRCEANTDFQGQVASGQCRHIDPGRLNIGKDGKFNDEIWISRLYHSYKSTKVPVYW